MSNEKMQKRADRLKQIDELKLEISEMDQPKDLEPCKWFLKLPAYSKGRMRYYYLPDKTPKDKSQIKRPKNLGEGKFEPPGRLIPEPVYRKMYHKMQMDVCSNRIKRIDLAYEPQLKPLTDEINKIEAKIKEIDEKHSRKEVENAQRQEIIDEYERLKSDYLEHEDGSIEDEHYLALEREMQEELAKIHEVKDDPSYDIPWPVKPDSKTKRQQNIKVLLTTYKSEKNSLESIRDAKKEIHVKRRDLNKDHYDKWHEIDQIARGGD